MTSHRIILLLATATLVVSIKGQQPYSLLDSEEKELVDLAVSKANKLFNSRHLNYYEHRNKEVGPYSSSFRIDVLLKPTVCFKNSGPSTFTHRPECGFRQTQHVFHCNVCKSNQNREPAIHCALEGAKIRNHQCKGRLPGSSGLLESVILRQPDEQNGKQPSM